MLGSLALAERVRFFRELATLVNAGMSLGMALATLETRPGGTELRLAIRDAARRVGAGQRFSDVMTAHPRVFSELNRAMVAAGEQGGRLDEMLSLSADYLESDLEFQQTIARETFYPKIIAGAVVLIPLATKVIIAGIADGVFKAVVAALTGIAAYTLIVGVPLLVALFMVRRYQATDQGRVMLDRLKMRVPLVGPIVMKLAWSRTCRALSALYSAGVPINAAVELASRTAGNRAVEQTLLQTLRPLEQGKRLSQILAEGGQIPPLAYSMLHTGEETGNIDVTMGKVADYFEAEAGTSLKKLTLAIVPVAILVFGVVVLFQLVGFYGGYFGNLLNQ